MIALVAASCGTPGDSAGSTAAPSPSASSAAAACPAVPQSWRDVEPALYWPARGTEELVPQLAEPLCATPAAPALAPALNEDAAMFPQFRSGAYGVVHRDGEALATLTVVEVAPNTPGLDQVVAKGPGAPARVGALDVTWYRLGDHVGVTWVEKSRLTSLLGADVTTTGEAFSAWMVAQGNDADASPPGSIPSAGDAPDAALEAGLPAEGLPPAYSLLPFDAVAFEAADAADTVTIHENDMESVGGGIILDSKGTIVATAVGSKVAADPKEKPFGNAPGSGPEGSEGGFEARTVNVGPTSILLVGSEADAIDRLDEAWTAALGG